MGFDETRAKRDRLAEALGGIGRTAEFLRSQPGTVEGLYERGGYLQRAPEVIGRLRETLLSQVDVSQVVQGLRMARVGLECALETDARIVQQAFVQEQDAQVVVGAGVAWIQLEHPLVGSHRVHAAAKGTQCARPVEMRFDVVGALFTGALEAAQRFLAPAGHHLQANTQVSPRFREHRALCDRAAQRGHRLVTTAQCTEPIAKVAPGFGKDRLQLHRAAIGLLGLGMAFQLLPREAQLEPAQRAASVVSYRALEGLDSERVRPRFCMQVADREPDIALRRIHVDRLLQA